MTSFSASWLPRTVLVPALGERIEVRPPTVGEAIAVLEGLPGVAEGDPEDAELLEDVLAGWIPVELMVELEELPSRSLTTVLRRLLFDGVELEEAKRKSDGDGEDGPPRWDLLLGDYVSLCRDGAWETVQEVPWPFFLRMLEAKEALSARELLRWARVVLLPHTGKEAKKTLSELSRAAKGGEGEKPRGLYTEEDLESWEPDESIERDRAALREAMGRPTGREADE